MRYYFSFLTSAALLSTTVVSENGTKECKCVPGADCWPSAADFSALNVTLSGHLIQSLPPASVCYTNQPTYNSTTCDYVLENWFQSTFHASSPISIGWPWWAHNSCPPIYPNGTTVTGDTEAGKKGCTIGAYPAYAVNAMKEEHVVAAVNFAREKGVRLNIKSTGHSFHGRSTAFGSLSVWTHNMRGFEYHENFQAASCFSSNGTQMAFTVAAGERVRDVYTAAHEQNLIVVGGAAQDVGIVGWFSGGGHGPLSSTYGFGVDNVLEITIVTPDGALRTTNPCLNPDLFWALRGGGGGTFGVITSVTMKAYPSPRGSRHEFTMALKDPEKVTRYWDLVASVMSELPRLHAGGMQGYSIIFPPGFDGAISWEWRWGFNVWDKPNGTIESLFAPIAEKLNPHNGTTIVYTSQVYHYPSFFALWNATVGFEPVALTAAAFGSRLLPAAPLTEDTNRLARMLENITTQAEGLVSTPMLQAAPVANHNSAMIKETSITPAWRDAVLHFIVLDYFPDSVTHDEAKPVLDKMTYDRMATLKSLAPESGAYLNEADPYDPDWQYTFYGSNYPKLKEVKEKFDPESVLWCLSCVGSEEWAEESSGTLCKVA
ncbi:FAD binding domain protein [Massariosphaeria phaeospora]|uniref:FAD binding domain protein n=1 Tax=Massariosphaeria phaeospora TaxID=100035 RepID=A0A7C8M8P8_9PLEO|nr:FAD binding domain protein [Massariosphaeria phaeospora]